MAAESRTRLTKAEAGRLGGIKSTGCESISRKKREASARNGKLGGRPPKPDADPKRRARYLASKKKG